MNATPPPFPVSLGWWIMEKLGGVSALRVDGKASEDSQVSERDKISMLWSAMNSAKATGLLSWAVTDEAEQMFRWAKLICTGGPGLSWMSPARSKIIENHILQWKEPIIERRRGDSDSIIKKPVCTSSRIWHTEAGGEGIDTNGGKEFGGGWEFRNGCVRSRKNS